MTHKAVRWFSTIAPHVWEIFLYYCWSLLIRYSCYLNTPSLFFFFQTNTFKYKPSPWQGGQAASHWAYCRRTQQKIIWMSWAQHITTDNGSSLFTFALITCRCSVSHPPFNFHICSYYMKPCARESGTWRPGRVLTWGLPRRPSPPRPRAAWPRPRCTPASGWAPETWRAHWDTACWRSGSPSGNWGRTRGN